MGANNGKFPKKSVGVFVAIFALLVSASAVSLDYYHNNIAADEFASQININEEQNRQLKELVEIQKQQYEELKEQNRQLEELIKTQEQHHAQLKKEFEQTYEPHTRHEQISDYISLLYDRIVLFRDYLGYFPYERRKVAEVSYIEALNHFSLAELALREKRFDDALEEINLTYDYLSEAYKEIESSNTTTSE